MRRLLALVAIAALMTGVAMAASYTATFDGTPVAPQPFVDPHFDVQLHERNTDGSMPPLIAQHGPDCAAPPATHVQDGGVFICANHVMTALNGEDYGLIILTPDQMLDFSSGGTVSFDLSTERMSTRDWWDITVSPFLNAQALPLLSDLSQGVDLQGPNRNSIVVSTDNLQGSPNLKVVRSGVVTSYPNPGIAFNSGVTAANPAATRQTFRLTLGPASVRFERLASATASALIFFDQAVPALSWTQGVVQFGHHSYNPTKDFAGQPATWHWDNFAVDPVVPFYIGAVSPRALTDPGTLTFAAAPAGSYLRFSALCRPKINGVIGTKMTDTGHPEHASSYLMPIPQGATSAALTFASDGWYATGLGCIAKDFSVFSLNGAPAPTPAPTPVPTPIPTPAPPTYSCVRNDGTVMWGGEVNPRSCP